MTNTIKLSKENRSTTIKLSKEKPVGKYGKIDINLNWNQGQAKKGFFSSLLGGGNDSVDLDLGCLFELKDGRKGSVQALGNNFGSYDREPFVVLDADDRTGSSSDGEWMHINGDNWSRFKRVVIYAFIYEGVANWSNTDGVVTMKVNGENIEVKMDETSRDKRLCAVALLENINDEIHVKRLVDYYNDQEKLDHALNWGMRWTKGSKD